MRSPPTPALQNVLVARPGAHNNHPSAAEHSSSTALVRRDDLLAAAALAAAEDAPPRPRPRPRVLAAMSRRISRISGSLRRRRHHPPSPNLPSSTPPPPQQQQQQHHPRPQLPKQTPAIEFQPRPTEREHVPHFDSAPFSPQQDRNESTPFDIDPMEPPEHDLDLDVAVSSLRDPISRRLRQVGAREDDDTLLLLPRVTSVSFNAEQPIGSSLPPRVRQLPRVSALMPVRPSRAAHSPVSSESDRRSASYGSSYDPEEDDEEDAEHERRRRTAFCRLPTGMTNVDVERGIESAVVEIASDGESDAEQGKDELPLWSAKGEDMSGVARMMQSRTTRSRSEAHQQTHSRAHKNDSQGITSFSRRISSSTHTATRMLTDSELRATKAQPETGKDFALFEDDYLSFQGFHGQPESSKSHYQSMSSLLRNRRTSSVTDSHSEDSDEAANVKAIGSTDSRWRMGRRTPIMPIVFRMKRGVVLDDDEEE